MSDTPRELEDLPEPLPSNSRFSRLPLVWLLPVVVVLAALFVVIHEKLSQGPSIEIQFHNAEGLEANKTKVRYKDVDIGDVTDVRVSPDRKNVIVTARIHREAREYLLDDTRFWVVRPRISSAGVSGLTTLVSGEYISIDVGHSENSSRYFVGVEMPPIVTADVPGREFILHAEDLGSLDIGSSVFYRHMTAGQVLGYTMDAGGTGVTIKVFVNAPFDTYVTNVTRFWQASGIDMSLNADGVRLHTESLTSILEGGVAFASLPNARGAAVADDSAFTLYSDHDRAMRPVETEIRSFVMYFKGSLRGLASGAAVDLNGIDIGEVRSLDVEYDESAGGLRFPVVIEVYPQRIRGKKTRAGNSPGNANEDAAASRLLFDSLVAHGLRAELRTGNLLTGQKFVAFDMHPGAAKAKVAWADDPAVFPTVSNGLDELQDSIGSIARKIDKVPFDQLSFKIMNALDSLGTTLKSADHLMGNVDRNIAPQIQATLSEAQAAMKNAKDVLSQDAPLQSDLGAALMQVSRAAKSVSALVEYLERHPEALLRGKPKDSP